MLPTESALPRAARFLSDLVKDAAFVRVRSSPSGGSEGRGGLVRRPPIRRRGRLLLAEDLRLARRNRNQDPRPLLLGCLRLRLGTVLKSATTASTTAPWPSTPA